MTAPSNRREWTPIECEAATVACLPDDPEGEFVGIDEQPKRRLNQLLNGKSEYSGNVHVARVCARSVGRALLTLRAERDEARRDDDMGMGCFAMIAETLTAHGYPVTLQSTPPMFLNDAVHNALAAKNRLLAEMGAVLLAYGHEKALAVPCAPLRSLLVEAARDGLIQGDMNFERKGTQAEAESIADRILGRKA